MTGQNVTIYGPDNRPLSTVRQHAASYHGASTTSGSFDNWLPFPASADADLAGEKGILTGRSRDLYKNHGLANGITQTFADNILGGVGLSCTPDPDYVTLGWTPERAREWAKNVKARWRAYSEGIGFEVDATGQADIHGLAVQALFGMMINGEHIAVARWLTDEPARKYRTALQLVEADRLSNPNNRMDTRYLRGGVELDTMGRVVAYHIRDSHPGDVGIVPGAMGGKWERVPAKKPWGRQIVLHVFDRQRTEEHHGRPSLTAVMADFKTGGEFQRAHVERALTNAMVAAILEAPMDGMGLSEMFGDGESYVAARSKAPSLRLRRNAILRLFPGEKFSTYNPGDASAGFGPFMETLLRMMAAGLNVPYELLLKDFSKTNYSSARAALLEAWRFFMNRRALLSKYFYRPTYALWLEEAIDRGDVEGPDFYENRACYVRSRWIGPGRGSIDPLKEANANAVRLQNGMATLEDICAEDGSDWEEKMEQRKREIDKARELDIPFLTTVAGPGVLPPEPADLDEAEDNR